MQNNGYVINFERIRTKPYNHIEWLHCKLQTRSLVRDGAPQKHYPKFQTATFRQEIISDRKSLKGAPYQDILTDWPTVSRKVTSTSTLITTKQQPPLPLSLQWGNRHSGDVLKTFRCLNWVAVFCIKPLEYKNSHAYITPKDTEVETLRTDVMTRSFFFILNTKTSLQHLDIDLEIARLPSKECRTLMRLSNAYWILVEFYLRTAIVEYIYL
jgi:hypothetical protein